MIEAQVRYAMKCLKLMKRRKQRVIEVRGSLSGALSMRFTAACGTVWQSGGCHSWYQDQSTAKSQRCGPAP